MLVEQWTPTYYDLSGTVRWRAMARHIILNTNEHDGPRRKRMPINLLSKWEVKRMIFVRLWKNKCGWRDEEILRSDSRNRCVFQRVSVWISQMLNVCEIAAVILGLIAAMCKLNCLSIYSTVEQDHNYSNKTNFQHNFHHINDSEWKNQWSSISQTWDLWNAFLMLLLFLSQLISSNPFNWDFAPKRYTVKNI